MSLLSMIKARADEDINLGHGKHGVRSATS
jgi:hypothetical protein